MPSGPFASLCFRGAALLEAGAFPGQLLLVAAYYMQIREALWSTCSLGALAVFLLHAQEHAFIKRGDHSFTLQCPNRPQCPVLLY